MGDRAPDGSGKSCGRNRTRARTKTKRKFYDNNDEPRLMTMKIKAMMWMSQSECII